MFEINENYTLIFIVIFLVFGFYVDITIVNYIRYFFFFKGIAGILLIIIWFQVCKKFKSKRIIEAIGVMFSGIIYIFFIVTIEAIELKNNGIKTYGIIQDFKKSHRKKTYGSYPFIFMTNTQKKYEGEINGNIGIYQKDDTVSFIYSKRIPEINRAD